MKDGTTLKCRKCGGELERLEEPRPGWLVGLLFGCVSCDEQVRILPCRFCGSYVFSSAKNAMGAGKRSYTCNECSKVVSVDYSAPCPTGPLYIDADQWAYSGSPHLRPGHPEYRRYCYYNTSGTIAECVSKATIVPQGPQAPQGPPWECQDCTIGKELLSNPNLVKNYGEPEAK